MTVEQVSEIVKLIGLAAAGLWAAYTFHKLQKVRTAELENSERLSAIEKSRIEQQEVRARLLRQQPQLAMQLNISEAAFPTETSRTMLCITVTLRNEGEQNLRIQFPPSALTVARMQFDERGQKGLEVNRYGPSYFDTNSNDPQLLRERLLRIGQQRQMVLATLPINEPGCFIVQFNALYERFAFDGEDDSVEPSPIEAIEQSVFCATASVQPERVMNGAAS